MLIEVIVGLAVVAAVGVFVYKRFKKEETTYVDGSTLTYDDVYPPSLTTEPVVVHEKVVIEEKPKAPKKKAIAKKTAPKKRGRPAKKKTKK